MSYQEGVAVKMARDYYNSDSAEHFYYSVSGNHYLLFLANYLLFLANYLLFRIGG